MGLALAAGLVEVVCFQQLTAADADLPRNMAVLPISGQHIAAADLVRWIDGDVMGAAESDDVFRLEDASPMAAAPGFRNDVEVEADAGIDKGHEIADWGFKGGEIGHVSCSSVVVVCCFLSERRDTRRAYAKRQAAWTGSP